MGRIGRSRRIHVDVQALPGANSGRVTISVAVIVRAAAGNILSLRRLRELPHFGETNSAVRRIGWALRKSAPGRRWAGVIDGPVSDLARAGALANVFGSHYFLGIGRRLAGAIDSWAESCRDYAVDPGKDVGLLLGQHAATLLLIEENDSVARESLALRRRSRRPRI